MKLKVFGYQKMIQVPLFGFFQANMTKPRFFHLYFILSFRWSPKANMYFLISLCPHLILNRYILNRYLIF